MNFTVYSQGKKVNDLALLQNVFSENVGVFETLRSYGNRIFRLEEHLDRLLESVKTTGFTLKQTRRELKQEIQEAFKVYQKENSCVEGMLRITFYRDHPFVMIGQRQHSSALYKKGVRLKTSVVRRSLSNASFPEAKSNAYQNAIFAHLEPRPEETYEWIFLDQNGYVTEVSIGNLFMVKQAVGASLFATNRWTNPSSGGAGARFGNKKSNGQTQGLPLLVTPPTAGILNGVTRQIVVECALQAGVKVEERPLMRHDLYNASEVFLTNTSWEVLPVSSIDSRKINGSIPGSLTQWLQKRFREKVKQECL